MQIVIDIPNDKYDWIKEHKGATDFGITQMLYNRVRNGTHITDKQSWETEKKCEWGYFADLTKLPIGTTFHVVNGEWEGKIIEKGNQKYLLCSDTGKHFPITGNEDLVIDDVRIIM